MFKIGSKVIIHPESDYYVGGEVSNPILTIGVVTELEWGDCEVRWANNCCNSYGIEDLIHVKSRRQSTNTS